MLRCLVEALMVDLGDDLGVYLLIRWTGGASEDLPATLPPTMQDRLRYPPQRVEEIRRLATEHTDAEIAEFADWLALVRR